MSNEKYAWTAVDRHAAQRLGVKAVDWQEVDGIGEKLVMLQQTAQSMHFQFTMTPVQAREMAMALIAAAEALA